MNKKELKDKKNDFDHIADKLVTLEQLKTIVNEAKEEKQRVVWTNGCFDIFHAGHIIYLERARSQGDILVVGLNSDASVRKSKGDSRPIINEQYRAKLLTALMCVDYVIIYDEESPLNLIKTLQPDVYAKGGDYTIDTINQQERAVMESFGGDIALLPGVEGMSTTILVNKILAVYKE